MNTQILALNLAIVGLIAAARLVTPGSLLQTVLEGAALGLMLTAIVLLALGG